MKPNAVFDAELKVEGYIPVTTWLGLKGDIAWLERERRAIEWSGIMCKVKKHNKKKCLYRKLSPVEVANLQLYGNLFSPNQCNTRGF